MKKQFLLLTLLVGAITSLNAAESYTANEGDAAESNFSRASTRAFKKRDRNFNKEARNIENAIDSESQRLFFYEEMLADLLEQYNLVAGDQSANTEELDQQINSLMTEIKLLRKKISSDIAKRDHYKTADEYTLPQ